jgi:hypothetical protein
MVRDVVELLAIAHRGLTEAESNFDEKLRRQSMRLLEKAVKHPDAPAFFAAAQLAIDESIGNDPDVDDNGEGIIDPEENTNIDEDSPAAGPADEGVTDDEGDTSTDMNSGDDEEQGSAGGNIVLSTRPKDMIAAFAANLDRFRNVG